MNFMIFIGVLALLEGALCPRIDYDRINKTCYLWINRFWFRVNCRKYIKIF